MDNDTLKSYIDNIENHLSYVESIIKKMSDEVSSSEGDSDLHRKLCAYLLPAINHWVNSAQAGSIKDLRDLLNRRQKTK